MSKIPNVIHFCWFGGKPLPPFALKCIESWKKYFPSYEIKKWDESNFDVNAIPYVREAYSLKKFAFVSDYARFWILFNYGGLYFDTDVEIVKDMNHIIENGPFMGCEFDCSDESGIAVSPGLGLGAVPKMQIYGQILDLYKTLHFVDDKGAVNYTTVVAYVTNLLKKNELRNVPGIQQVGDVKIYPKEFFCPMNSKGKMDCFSRNTVAIHHFSATWKPKSTKMKELVQRMVGKKITKMVVRIKTFVREF